MVKGPICVVKISVLKTPSILLVMECVKRHSLRIGIENAGFIHVIPYWVKVIGAGEFTIRESLSPKVLSIFIKEINPNWLTRPAVPKEKSGRVFPYKGISQGARWTILHNIIAIVENRVCLHSFDVRVYDKGNPSIRFFYLIWRIIVHFIFFILYIYYLVECSKIMQYKNSWMEFQ